MGQCIKCGKETENCYEYYIAEIGDASNYTHYREKKISSVEGNFNVTRTYRYYFHNFTLHNDFFCSRHQTFLIIMFFIISAVSFVISFCCIGAGAYNGNTNQDSVIGLVIIILSMLAGVGFLIWAFRTIFVTVKDKKSDLVNDGLVRFKWEKSDASREHRAHEEYCNFFTPDQYKNLKTRQ